MQQGDIVYVPKAPKFYIYGEVLKPSGYRVEPKLSLAQALSLGGGWINAAGYHTERGIVIKHANKNDVIFVNERCS